MMAKKSNLPIEVHDHFRKANLLHGYVVKGLGEATQHALETGRELLAAKQTIPHGSWETECKRLFDGTLRTAQFYMQFTRDVSALPKAQESALLLLEGTLEGAAKAAKKAANPTKPKPPQPAASPPVSTGPIDVESQPVSGDSPDAPEDYGRCPNCLGSKWDDEEEGVSCAKCHHPHGEPAGDVDEDRIKTQRQITVKMIERLMRAFDDLQVMLARPEHDQAIADCKRLLAVAKGWK